MAVFAVTITKSTPWRGTSQEFSNQYHYRTDPGQTFDDQAVIDALVAAEKPVHSSFATFVKARTWGPTDQGQAASVTREIVDLSGSGTATATSGWYRELAMLVVWPMGRYGSKNRPQYLRKWLHTMSNLGASSSAWAQGSDPITTPPAAIMTYIGAVETISQGVNGVVQLTNAQDRGSRGAGYLYPYLEHHQLGDAWR